MYFPDFAPYSYNLPVVLPSVGCIGWLKRGRKFARAKADAAFLDKMASIIRRECVHVTRGTHNCDFCSEGRIWLDDKSELLGHAEMWIPATSRDVVFSAPTLIYHYCREHDYAPPQEFIDAVMNFDLASQWFGEAERERKVRAAFE